MSKILRPWLMLATIAATTAAGVLGAAPASADPVASGTLTMESDPGDFIGLGLTYGYSTEASDSFDATASTDGTVVSVNVFAANGDFWSLDFEAPNGQPLTAGTYTGAIRYPFNPLQVPGLSIISNGRGCNELTGQFTVNAASFGPQGYLELFDVTFEQHCEGVEPALRGHLVVSNPPPPPQLTLGVTVAATGVVSTVSGNAILSGTVTCNTAASVNVTGTLTQVVKKAIVRGPYNTVVGCTPGAPVAWQATAIPEGTTPFQKGDAEARSFVFAQDPNYPGAPAVTVSLVDVVALRKA
jgi:hypothetical protein